MYIHFFIMSQKLLFRTSYHLYAQALNYQTHTHQLDFLKNKNKITNEPRQTRKDLRPWHKSVRRGKSYSAVSIFVQAFFGKLFTVDLDSPSESFP